MSLIIRLQSVSQDCGLIRVFHIIFVIILKYYSYFERRSHFETSMKSFAQSVLGAQVDDMFTKVRYNIEKRFGEALVCSAIS